MNAVISSFVGESELSLEKITYAVLTGTVTKNQNKVDKYPAIKRITWLRNLTHQNNCVNGCRNQGEDDDLYIMERDGSILDDSTLEAFDGRCEKCFEQSVSESDEIVKIIEDILTAKSIEELRLIHSEIHYQVHGHYMDPFSDKPDEKSWKYRLLECNYIETRLRNSIAITPTPLIYGECSLEMCHHFARMKEKLTMIQKQYCAASSDEFAFLGRMIELLEEQINLILMQNRLYADCGSFGLQSYNAVQLRVHSPREVIRTMMAFLFKNLYIGSFDDELLYQEEDKRAISRYLSSDTIKFKNNHYEAIRLRVLYYLHPDKRTKTVNSKTKSNPLTPLQFTTQLWQFYYYSFGIDFFMLQPENDDTKDEEQTKIEEWYGLVMKTLKNIETKSIAELQEEIRSFYADKKEEYMKKKNVDVRDSYIRSFSKEDLLDVSFINVIADQFFRNIEHSVFKQQDSNVISLGVENIYTIDVNNADVLLFEIHDSETYPVDKERSKIFLAGIQEADIENEETFLVNTQDPDIRSTDIAVIKIKNMVRRQIGHLEKTVSVMEKLLQAESEEKFIRLCGFDELCQRRIRPSNDWKVSIYFNMVDTFRGDSTYMSYEQLNAFLKAITACCVGNHMFEGQITLDDWRKKITSSYSEIKDMIQIYSEPTHGLYAINQNFIEMKILEQFEIILRLANRYFAYYDWQKKNLKWKQ